MSRPSTAQSAKNPSLARPSAWSKGPPTSTPSRSQSPAPATPVFHTHSRRPSALSGVSIKDGVTVNRNNAGAAKHGSAVTFGSIDDVSAPISSSPAAAPAIKSESVKSFGTIDADTHVNGKSTLSARPSVAVPASTTSSSASSPAVSVASPALKLAKTDIAKLFQNPSSAPSSQPPSDTSSPSLRSTGLPSSQHPTSSQPSQSSVPPQPSQLSSHSSFIPYRHPPSAVGSGPSRSPAFPPRQSANGSGPRPPGGPNGAPSQINAGMPSPRLGPMPHNGQAPGMPPPPQVPVGQQVPVAWGGYYYPAPDTYGYPAHHQTWFQPPHHIPGGPHGPPHAGMPISPRNPTIPLQPGSGTPTLSHAVANPVHSPHPPPPLAHPSASMGSISSPPPTPSTNPSRLNANSSTFAPRPKVTLKTADGTEVAIADLSSKTSASPSPANNMSTNGPGTFRQGSPANGNVNRRVRLETEDQQRKRLAEEERAKAEIENKARREKEAEERKRREQEELKRKEEEAKKREEEARKRKEEEEKERIRKEEEEKERLRKEEEEKERLRKEEEERARREAEEKERQRKEEEERERIRLEEAEKERKRKEEEERERIRKEEEERQRKEEEERKRKEEEAERERLRREEEEEKERQRQEAEKAAKARELEKEAEAGLSKEEGELDALEQHDTMPSPKADNDKKFKEPLRINTAEPHRRRPGPLDLSNTGPVSAAPRSAVATARVIDDLSRVSYPEGISSPNPDLNANAKDGKFRYDRDFLLQFMAICKEKPDMLPPLDAIGLEPIDQSSLALQRGGSGRHRQSSGPPAVQRGNQIGLGFGPAPTFPKSSGLNPFVAGGGMGNFQSPKLTSDERFYNSTNRSASVSGTSGFGGRPISMQRTPSQGGPGSAPSNRTRSQRGKQRDKVVVQQTASAHAAQVANLEPVAPLKVSENRWDRKALHADGDSPEVVDRKVRGLLNKLTMERFDSISDQIIEWANKSEKEKDGRTLIQVIRLVFEKATDEATWSEMYARLCRKMMEQISTKVQDDGIRNSEGKPIAGGQLFRKYLLNRCQEDFERGWVTKEATAAAAATKAMEDQAIKAANEKGAEGGDDEVALYSDEYYAAQKAKRQGLGLIKFIGELFKLQMLTERIMHECVKKLLGNVNNPEEEEIESLCKLLTTVGQILDTPKAHGHMDVYFKRMRELAESTNVSPRMQFMLQDVLELRERKWVARNAVAAPSTIAQIHEAAAKEKAAQEKEFSQRQISMSRGGSRRGGDRSEQSPANPEGWAVAGNTARPPSKVDLSNFGKINKAPPTTFGPGSVFAGKKDKRESLSRTSSSSNMFSMLQNAESAADKASEAPLQRRKLALLPRTKPIENETQQQESDEDEAPSPAAAPTEMSDEAAKKKIDEDSKELFGVRNLAEAEVYFSALPAQHHHKLVEKLVSTAVESKEADAQLVSDLFGVAASKNLCSPAAFEEGLASIAEFIEDIAIDAPKAFDLFAIMMKGASLDEERRSRIASKSEASEKILLLLS